MMFKYLCINFCIIFVKNEAYQFSYHNISTDALFKKMIMMHNPFISNLYLTRNSFLYYLLIIFAKERCNIHILIRLFYILYLASFLIPNLKLLTRYFYVMADYYDFRFRK